MLVTSAAAATASDIKQINRSTSLWRYDSRLLRGGRRCVGEKVKRIQLLPIDAHDSFLLL